MGGLQDLGGSSVGAVGMPCGCIWRERDDWQVKDPKTGHAELSDSMGLCSELLPCSPQFGCFCEHPGTKVLSLTKEQCMSEEVCRRETNLTLTRLTTNNLGGQGPDSDKEQALIFADVFPESGNRVFLKVTNTSIYQKSNLDSDTNLDFPAGKNGVVGDFARIDLRIGTVANLIFQFTDEDGLDYALTHPFTMVGLDLDSEGSFVPVTEEISISKSEFTAVKVGFGVRRIIAPYTDTFIGKPDFSVKRPQSPSQLFNGHMARAVALEFPRGTSKFQLKMAVSKGLAHAAQQGGGRSLLFAGQSNFQCWKCS